MQRFEREDDTMRRENDEQEAFERKRNRLARKCTCGATSTMVGVTVGDTTYFLNLCGWCDGSQVDYQTNA